MAKKILEVNQPFISYLELETVSGTIFQFTSISKDEDFASTTILSLEITEPDLRYLLVNLNPERKPPLQMRLGSGTILVVVPIMIEDILSVGQSLGVRPDKRGMYGGAYILSDPLGTFRNQYKWEHSSIRGTLGIAIRNGVTQVAVDRLETLELVETLENFWRNVGD
jgi:hypothetical protein